MSSLRRRRRRRRSLDVPSVSGSLLFRRMSTTAGAGALRTGRGASTGIARSATARCSKCLNRRFIRLTIAPETIILPSRSCARRCRPAPRGCRFRARIERRRIDVDSQALRSEEVEPLSTRLIETVRSKRVLPIGQAQVHHEQPKVLAETWRERTPAARHVLEVDARLVQRFVIKIHECDHSTAAHFIEVEGCSYTKRLWHAVVSVSCGFGYTRSGS